jgi:MFS family permease
VPGGKLADLLGRKTTFLTGLIGFAAGGAATSLAMLVTARACPGAFDMLLAPRFGAGPGPEVLPMGALAQAASPHARSGLDHTPVLSRLAAHFSASPREVDTMAATLAKFCYTGDNHG